jgi:lysophospholipase L1-like esterase
LKNLLNLRSISSDLCVLGVFAVNLLKEVGMRIYVLGDSISIQYGPYLQRYLGEGFVYTRKTAAEEAALGVSRPQGDNGGDSSMVLEFLRAKQQAGGLAADLLLLNCGLHDIRTDPQQGTKQVPIDQYEANLHAIVELARDLQVDLVWVRTTPCDERVHNQQERSFHRFAADVQAYNTVADSVMAAHGVPSIDLYTFTGNLGPDLYCDHVHFHEPVREKQAAYIAGWIHGHSA